ncbi:outer membrane beta-barrel protein [Flavobacterium sp. MC2016-06]|jgi:opacity protein-like surface antigen|uniref:outer membrane beta-barrel protein n=1 Tax=Flavobacterium sp. MC2016-06 TaxID=2676308 RepID=UPI0012BAA537|nr:outer membrane beta-barrel protein [Flavobacterium sp. MC2016-06]MBU3861782.1 porin family protein [Flavobacterium sp. MC2016-06]
MKQYGLLLVVFLSAIGMNAQEGRSFSLNLYGGYNFSDSVDYNGYSGKIEDAFQYGAGFEYFFSNNNSVELKYLRADTKMPFYGPAGAQLNAGHDKGALNYILADYTHYFEVGSNVLPFLGAGAGVGIIETPQSGSGTYFAWDIKAGVKIKTASKVSINLHAYLESMSAAVGNSYYWTYYGPVGVEDYVSTYQFGLGAAFSFNFKK